MDPNKDSFHTQNSYNYPFNYPNPNNYQFQNQSSNQSQNLPNYGYLPNFFMPSAVPNFPPYFGSAMSYSSQTPPYSSTPPSNVTNPNFRAVEFQEISTQMTFGAMSGVHEAVPDSDDPTPTRRKNSKWSTEQNLVLLGGWIKYGTYSIIGKNQKGDSYWGKIVEFCNEHCSFDPPRDGDSCRNHYNYVNKILGKWVGAYDKVKRMQQSGWSEDDVLAKPHEQYSSAGNGNFKYMKEWLAVRDQPRFGSQVGGNTDPGSHVGGNTGTESSGSKGAQETDASDSNFLGFIARPMGRDAANKKAKKKGKGAAFEVVNEDWIGFQQIKAQEFERLDKIVMMQEEANRRQEEANQLMKENTQAKNMKMYLKLSEKKDLDERSKVLLEKLGHDLFDE